MTSAPCIDSRSPRATMIPFRGLNDILQIHAFLVFNLGNDLNMPAKRIIFVDGKERSQ